MAHEAEVIHCSKCCPQCIFNGVPFYEISCCDSSTAVIISLCAQRGNSSLLNDWGRSNPAWWVFLCHLGSVRKEPKHIQLIVPLFHCVHTELFWLCQDKNPTLSPSWSAYDHRKRSSGRSVILRQEGNRTERCEVKAKRGDMLFV